MAATTGRRTSDRAADGNADAEQRGRDAPQPTAIPGTGWKDIAKRTKAQVKDDNVALLAAGVAFFALLSLVPALGALVSVYGMVADPADIERQVADVLSAAPGEVRDLVEEQLTSITESSSGGLGLTALLGIALALWSASSGMKHLITAINVAYDEGETRGFLKLRGTARARSRRTAVGLDSTGHGRRHGAVGARIGRLLDLHVELRFLRRDLRIAGCGRGPDALAHDLGGGGDHRR